MPRRCLTRSIAPVLGLPRAGGATGHAALWEMAAQPCLVALEGALAAALETNMGDAWRQTMVAVVTEFGCTRPASGVTEGADHATGTVAGGALRGGRVIADRPGPRPRS
jgi:uncharacterized protein (DUF1501 family)